MSDLKWAAELFDDLEEGAVLLDAIAVASYQVEPENSDDNGVRFGYHTSSDAPLSTVIGLLEIAKLAIMQDVLDE